MRPRACGGVGGDRLNAQSPQGTLNLGRAGKNKEGEAVCKLFAEGEVVCWEFIDTRSDSDLMALVEPALFPKVMPGIGIAG